MVQIDQIEETIFMLFPFFVLPPLLNPTAPSLYPLLLIQLLQVGERKQTPEVSDTPLMNEAAVHCSPPSASC